MLNLIAIISFLLSVFGLLCFLSVRDNADQSEEETSGKSKMVVVGAIAFIIFLMCIFKDANIH